MALNPEAVMQKAVEGLSGTLAQLRYLRTMKDEVVIAKEEIPKFDEAISKLSELIQVVARLEVKSR